MRDSSTSTGAMATHVNGSDVVFGMPIEDNGNKKVVRRVIILAATAASFYIVHFITNLMSGVYDERTSQRSLWTAMSSLLIELSIPLCGYYGALHGNRQLMCCFCSCNLFVTVVSVVSFIRLNVRMVELDGQCEREKSASHRRSCEAWTAGTYEKYMMIGSLIIGTCLGTIAFWIGGSLYQRLAHEFMHSDQHGPPLVGEVISLATSDGSNPLAAGTLRVAPGANATQQQTTSGVTATATPQQGQAMTSVIVGPAVTTAAADADAQRARTQAANLRVVSLTQTSGDPLSTTLLSPSESPAIAPSTLPAAPISETGVRSAAEAEAALGVEAEDDSNGPNEPVTDRPNPAPTSDASVCVASVSVGTVVSTDAVPQFR
jgi:hypothetical protein